MNLSLSQDDRQDIQGLVTTGFAHLPCAGFLFLQATKPAAARSWLGRAWTEVLSAAPWPHAADGTKLRPSGALSIAITYDGLGILGLPQTALDMFTTEFIAGMPTRADVLGDWGDSHPDNWQLGGHNTGPFHFLVIAHEANEDALTARLDQLQADAVAAGLSVVAVERGARDSRSREIFGFAADGLSEPDIEGIRSTPTPGQEFVPTGEFLLGHINALAAYPISPAVAEKDDPKGLLANFPENALPGWRDFGRNGTFLVYRKLHQEVAEFWRFVSAACVANDPSLARNRTSLAAATRTLAAKFVGRWPSGAPVAMTPERDDPSLGLANTFGYLPDVGGLRCPVGAHIRRSNPRDSLRRVSDTAAESLVSVSQHRVLRRGIRYGEPLFDLDDIDGTAILDLNDDGQDRGLHFVCLNADSQRQFEFIQQSWINHPAFLGLFNNKDPLLGDNDGTGTATVPAVPLRHRVTDVPRFVTVRGGAYFFLPGLRALQYLSSL